MEPLADLPVSTLDIPAKTTVVVIGAGIAGLSAALTLIERGIPVCVLDKGRIGAEQSGRNLGWVRKTSRAPADVPLAQAADRLWAAMPARTGSDCGYRQAGILFVTRSRKQMAVYEDWLKAVAPLDLGARALSPSEIDHLVPGGTGGWTGGLHTASDGRAEPSMACAALARAVLARGGQIVEHCAVRTLSTAAGKVSGVVTERGEIACDQVILAAGLWSRRFLGNLGLFLPTLPLVCSVLRTAPMEGPCETAVGGPDFSFRKRLDGGFTITQRGRLDAPLTPDHLRLGLRYLPVLRTQKGAVQTGLGRHFLNELLSETRWRDGRITPFERCRIMDPPVNAGLNAEALAALRKAWPVFEKARTAAAWAGMIDVTPDSDPVIDSVARLPGLTVATGFSGHGFGTGPAAGQLAADLATGAVPLVDPAPYRFSRF